MIKPHLFIFIFFVAELFSCSEKTQVGSSNVIRTAETAKSTSEPLNVIFLIGDGMGLTQLSTRYYYPDGPIHFERFNNIGLINTSSQSHKITDSAAGATAFASGVLSYNSAVGMDADTLPVSTLIEELSERGYKTGLVSTSSITHATPACFYAHVRNRWQYEEIAEQLMVSDVDFIAGGGLKFFNARTDTRDLLAGLKSNGFTVMTDRSLPMLKTIDGNSKYALLNADDGMPKMTEGRGNYLPLATQMALDYLSQSADGFFLMIEGAQIDWGGHANDAEYIITEMADFDRAVGVAMDFAERRGNTLVIVTADHETGGFALSGKLVDGSADYDQIEPTFTTGGHTTSLIPVFTYGPGSESFKGFYKNTGIYDRIKAACK